MVSTLGGTLARRRRPAARGRLGLVVALLLPLVAATAAPAQDVARGRQVFQLCASCHGTAGEGNRLYNAPVIAGLPQWYVEAQLTKFRKGLRGFRGEDITGLQMRPMARALTTEADVKSVAAYVAGLKPVTPPATLKGDATRGQAAYAICVACHGDKGQGNQAIGSPALTNQADWYLAAQIVKFRQGLRGTHPADTTGAQMRPMAMTLPGDQAIEDVVAYIRTLGR